MREAELKECLRETVNPMMELLVRLAKLKQCMDANHYRLLKEEIGDFEVRVISIVRLLERDFL